MNLHVLPDSSESVPYADPRLPLYIVPGTLGIFPGMRALCHWHEDVELLWPVQGHLHYRVGGVDLTVRTGQAVFVNARQMHYGYSADGSDCRYTCITFHPRLLPGGAELQRRCVLPITDQTALPYVLLDDATPAHRPLMAQLRAAAACARSAPPGYELAALGCLALFWQGLYTLVQPQLQQPAPADFDTAAQKQMLEYIRRHYREPLTLAQIARAGGVCRSRCCRIFRAYLGRTPNACLNSYRLEKSCALLSGSDASIAEIAYRCGFGSASYFSEFFRKEKGLSPRDYRALTARAPLSLLP